MEVWIAVCGRSLYDRTTRYAFDSEVLKSKKRKGEPFIKKKTKLKNKINNENIK